MLIVVAQFSRAAWAEFPFAQRVALVRRHYMDRVDARNIVERRWFFEDANLGVYVAYQRGPEKRFHHESREETRVDFITHAPHGHQAILPETPLERIPTGLARAIAADPDCRRLLSPPQCVLSVDEAAGAVDFANDLLGLSHALLLQVPGGNVLASHAVAAHLMAGRKPVLSGLGWAAQQLHGWFFGTLTPFQNTRRLPGSTRIRVDRNGWSETSDKLVASWFTTPLSRPMQSGFDRFTDELRRFYAIETLDVALSGGRDSRASAALFLKAFPEQAVLRTNRPAELEGIVARQLVERLPGFAGFNADLTEARDRQGRRIWWMKTAQVAEADIYHRARGWAYSGEGFILSAALYDDPPSSPVFAAGTESDLSVAGMAGECAKAYYWSPRMVSGAYARSLRAFREDISTIKINERMKNHPLTVQSALPLVAREYRQPLQQMVHTARTGATEAGIGGYRFFDYWWLTQRFANATVLFAQPTAILPFMVPEFITEALQAPPLQRARGQLLERIVIQTCPEWEGVPYFDEVQNSVPPELVRNFRESALLWEGELASGFFELLAGSPALDDPYDRASIQDLFSTGFELPQRGAANVQALGIVYRDAMWTLCEEIGQLISSARDGAPALPAGESESRTTGS